MKGNPMGTERQVMQEYLDTLVKRGDYPAFFTEDVIATFEGTDYRGEGRQGAGDLIRYVHEIAFDAHANATTRVRSESLACRSSKSSVVSSLSSIWRTTRSRS